LINYFKSYSSLGDDRFFVSPCTIREVRLKRHWSVFATRYARITTCCNNPEVSKT